MAELEASKALWDAYLKRQTRDEQRIVLIGPHDELKAVMSSIAESLGKVSPEIAAAYVAKVLAVPIAVRFGVGAKAVNPDGHFVAYRVPDPELRLIDLELRRRAGEKVEPAKSPDADGSFA